MSRRASLLFLIFPICLAPGLLGCEHQLEIMNAPLAPVAAPGISPPIRVGVVNRTNSPEVEGYVEAVARSLQLNGNVEKVIYPYIPSQPVDAIAYIDVQPQYRGVGTNFWVDWPGFLIFAPAWHGYSYHADVVTRAEVVSGDNQQPIGNVEWQYDYAFRQADIGRSWVEVGWLEWSAIPFIGGIMATKYDTDQTPHFITAAGPSYGNQVATGIAQQLVNYRESQGAKLSKK